VVRPRAPGDDTGGGDGGNGDGANGDGCSDAAKLVYVVDENNKLSKFDPMTKTFTDIGPRLSGRCAPVLDVDRSRHQRVGALQRREALQGQHDDPDCTATTWSTQLGLSSSDGVLDGDRGAARSTRCSSPVARDRRPDLDARDAVDHDMTASSRGTVTGWPELTGPATPSCGLLPERRRARIEKLNKATRRADHVPAADARRRADGVGVRGVGCDFWVFLMKGTELSTTVYQVDGASGQIKGMTSATSRTIVGAGSRRALDVIL